MIETPPLIINTSCFDFKVIEPSRRDVLTRGTKEQILAHNDTWDRNCKPKDDALDLKPADLPPAE